MAPELPEQACMLSYSDLEALSLRLAETTMYIRNPSFREDVIQAARAISHLASLKFAIIELMANCDSASVGRQLYALLGQDNN